MAPTEHWTGPVLCRRESLVFLPYSGVEAHVIQAQVETNSET